MLLRTQIMLEESQHRFLTEVARLKGISLSEVIRQLIEEKQREISLAQAEGAVDMSKGAVAGDGGNVHHDEVLYK
ncbi:hypothetical protein Psch_01292 [Pelotomaculum schinkii]|uniref:Ribbon-helix-helix protein CopG domain-containing protein n=1 Tax=Pelotomaculum schinkii TaxID=78350 RepID=A0A4Y7RHG2_9FIRM|nr:MULTISPECIES: hypothetical protein [Pelotomaculum]TEB07737.1 hypothetical protein Psch_01292 [Pelotomaculum schinkii]TEB16083.1 hypothetical protein Psfp_01681 [Pelotomaculum sp. FP]